MRLRVTATMLGGLELIELHREEKAKPGTLPYGVWLLAVSVAICRFLSLLIPSTILFPRSDLPTGSPPCSFNPFLHRFVSSPHDIPIFPF
jgi:hypothetical protein